MKWKARTETTDIDVLKLENLTFNEDYMELSIDIHSVSDSLRTEIEKAVEISKTESVKAWDVFYTEHPEYTRHDWTWSNKPVVIDYTYLLVVLEGGKAIRYSIETGFHDADNDRLEDSASVAVDLSEHTNELKKAIIKVLLDKFF